jgi:hypothetical protein
MKRPIFTLLLAGSLFLAACSSTTIQRDSAPIVGLRNPSVHFLVDNTRRLPTAGSFDWGFAIFRVVNFPGLNLSAVDKLIHESLEKVLTEKGFVKTEAAPDFSVSYALASGAGLDEMTLNGAYDGAVQAPPSAAGDGQQPLQYRRGSLIIDIVETKTKHLLWRGAIMADIDLNLSEAQKRLRCEGAVGELLKHYPKP